MKWIAACRPKELSRFDAPAADAGIDTHIGVISRHSGHIDSLAYQKANFSYRCSIVPYRTISDQYQHHIEFWGKPSTQVGGIGADIPCGARAYTTNNTKTQAETKEERVREKTPLSQGSPTQAAPNVSRLHAAITHSAAPPTASSPDRRPAAAARVAAPAF